MILNRKADSVEICFSTLFFLIGFSSTDYCWFNIHIKKKIFVFKCEAFLTRLWWYLT